MAKPDKNQQARASSPELKIDDEKFTGVSFDFPKEMIEQKLSRTFWKPQYAEHPKVPGIYSVLRGYLLGYETLNSPRFGAFDVLIVEATDTAMGVDGDDAPRRIEKGDIAIVVAGKNGQLQRVKPLGTHPDKVVEVAIQPVRKTDLPNGHTLWEFNFGHAKEAVPRLGRGMSVAALLGPSKEFIVDGQEVKETVPSATA